MRSYSELKQTVHSCKCMRSGAEVTGRVTTRKIPLVCGGLCNVLLLEDGTKIWGANLKLHTFQCLILLLLHITISRVADIHFTLTPLGH